MSYIKVVNKKYADEYVVGNLLKYGEEGENREFLGGCGISDLSDKYESRDMNFVKKLYGKENGRQAYQIIISIYKNRKTKNREERIDKYKVESTYAFIIAEEISDMLYEKGFQNAVYRHEDSDYVHLHFMINSVNYKTGRKASDMKELLNEVSNYLRKNYPRLDWIGEI